MRIVLDRLALELVDDPRIDPIRELGSKPSAAASVAASGAYSRSVRERDRAELGAVSGVKSCAPPYTVCTGWRVDGSWDVCGIGVVQAFRPAHTEHSGDRQGRPEGLHYTGIQIRYILARRLNVRYRTKLRPNVTNHAYVYSESNSVGFATCPPA